MLTIPNFVAQKNKNKISMVTCYDYWSAKILDQSKIDGILVGDSLAMVMHGHNSTLPATVDMMALHLAAVAKGAPSKLIVGDLPFLSFRSSLKENIENVRKIMQAGAHAVKLEGAHGNLELIEHLVQSGVPVMGHLGLTPQFVNQFGGFKVQAKSDEAKKALMDQALAMQKAGCFSIVLECVPRDIAEKVTAELHIPTIGIGAGSKTDGQILVLQDMLGLQKDLQPRFVRKFMNGFEQVLTAINHYDADVKAKTFPNAEESYE